MAIDGIEIRVIGRDVMVMLWQFQGLNMNCGELMNQYAQIVYLPIIYDGISVMLKTRLRYS